MSMSDRDGVIVFDGLEIYRDADGCANLVMAPVAFTDIACVFEQHPALAERLKLPLDLPRFCHDTFMIALQRQHGPRQAFAR